MTKKECKKLFYNLIKKYTHDFIHEIFPCIQKFKTSIGTGWLYTASFCNETYYFIVETTSNGDVCNKYIIQKV